MIYLERTPIYHRTRATLKSEHGFTLIELLVVLVVIGVLLAVAVPSYVGFRTRAADTTAKANIRAALPAVEQFAADNIGAKGDADNKKATIGYKGMTDDLLRSGYDTGIANSLTVVAGKTNDSAYCLTVTENGRTWSVLGPGVTDNSFKQNKNCK